MDDELLGVLSQRNVRLAREVGEHATIPVALLFLSAYSVLAGELTRASALIAAETAIPLATGAVVLSFGPLVHAAWRGDPPAAIATLARSIPAPPARAPTARASLPPHA